MSHFNFGVYTSTYSLLNLKEYSMGASAASLSSLVRPAFAVPSARRRASQLPSDLPTLATQLAAHSQSTQASSATQSTLGTLGMAPGALSTFAPLFAPLASRASQSLLAFGFDDTQNAIEGSGGCDISCTILYCTNGLLLYTNSISYL